ncbi:MAG: ABC transporter [Ruminococcaceae bacterium]|nr:ABC transporter [Oscillospiraceae bacterium]
MLAIYKRELKSYFYTPLGYVFVAFFMLVAGWIFSQENLMRADGELRRLFVNLILIMVVLIPILTMRLMAEEKNTKTDQLLLTSPISVVSIVVGKILSAFTVLFITLVVSLIFPFIISKYTEPAWGEIFGMYIGFFLMGISFISIGVFISSLTENQVISATITFVILFALYIVYSVSAYIKDPAFEVVLKYISIATRFNDFSKGIINIESVVYYLSIVVLFGFLTVNQIEKRRWTK